MYEFWETLCHAVRQSGSSLQQSTRLADMLIAIAASPDLQDLDGNTLCHESKVYWRDLPSFGSCWRDYGNRENYNAILDETSDGNDGGSEEDLVWQPRVEGLVSATTFSATLSVRWTFDDGRWFDAAVAMDNTLPSPLRDERQYMPSVLSARALVAAIWINIAGAEIYAACHPGHNTAREKPAHEHQYGFSPTKWLDWKIRLRDLAALPGIDAKSRHPAIAAVARMCQLDGTVEDGRPTS